MQPERKLKPVINNAYDINLTAFRNFVDSAIRIKKYLTKSGVNAKECEAGYTITLDVYLEAEKLKPSVIPLIVNPTSNSYETF